MEIEETTPARCNNTLSLVLRHTAISSARIEGIRIETQGVVPCTQVPEASWMLLRLSQYIVVGLDNLSKLDVVESDLLGNRSLRMGRVQSELDGVNRQHGRSRKID